MICPLSGEPIQEPVVSIKTGIVFEERLITKYLSTADTCPVTHTPLTKEDLVPLKGYEAIKTTEPRVAAAMGVPGLLGVFQNEWDAVMLENFTLKQDLKKAKEELAQTLYRQEAACRVIARLSGELDEAKKMLVSHQKQLAETDDAPQKKRVRAEAESEPAEGAIEVPADVKQRFVDLAAQSTKERKARTPSERLNEPADVAEFQFCNSQSVSFQKGVSSIAVSRKCVDFLETDGMNTVVVAGGADGRVSLFEMDAFDRKRKNNPALLKCFSKDTSPAVCTALAMDSSLAVVGRFNGDLSLVSVKDLSINTMKAVHTGSIASIAFHDVTNAQYLASASSNCWALHDIPTTKTIGRYYCPGDNVKISNIGFHPDGVLLATACTDGCVKIWDAKAARAGIVASLDEHTGPITSFAFSENAYFLATASEDCTVKIWDLRKVKCVETFDAGESPCRNLAFDYSGKYLSLCFKDHIDVFNVPKRFSEPLANGLITKLVADEESRNKKMEFHAAQFLPDAHGVLACGKNPSMTAFM